MPKGFTADAATRKAEALDREATAFLAAHESAESKDEVEKRRKADALNHLTVCDTNAGDHIDVETASEESLAGEVGGGLETKQEAALAKAERKAANKRRAKLETMELAPHTAQALRKRAEYLEQAIIHPESDCELKACVAELAAIWKRLKVAKIFATRIAPLLGISKRQSERLAEEGREIWANLIQIALGTKVDPDKALTYLATLSQSLQLAVAQEVERQREAWAIEHQIALYARAPKLDHGSLDALPNRQLCNRDVRRQLSLMESSERANRIAKMRLDERREAEERERQATTRDRARDARFALINTNLGSLLV